MNKLYLALGAAVIAAVLFMAGVAVGYMYQEKHALIRSLEAQNRIIQLEAEKQLVVDELDRVRDENNDELQRNQLEVSDLMAELRKKSRPDCRSDAPYILHDTAAKHSNLPENPHRQEPAPERDGLDVIQHETTEGVRLRLKVNALIDRIALASCIN